MGVSVGPETRLTRTSVGLKPDEGLGRPEAGLVRGQIHTFPQPYPTAPSSNIINNAFQNAFPMILDDIFQNLHFSMNFDDFWLKIRFFSKKT